MMMTQSNVLQIRIIEDKIASICALGEIAAIFQILGLCPRLQVKLAPRQPRDKAWHSPGSGCRTL